jgi:hypothetical protein
MLHFLFVPFSFRNDRKKKSEREKEGFRRAVFPTKKEEKCVEREETTKREI